MDRAGDCFDAAGRLLRPPASTGRSTPSPAFHMGRHVGNGESFVGGKRADIAQFCFAKT